MVTVVDTLLFQKQWPLYWTEGERGEFAAFIAKRPRRRRCCAWFRWHWLSQSQFAALLGVSVRTLQGWEQGRKQPSGAARTLLTIARTNPKALLAVAGK